MQIEKAIENNLKINKMKSLVKSIAVLAVIIVSSVSVFAATNATDTSSASGIQVVGGLALLLAVIVLPAFKGTKTTSK